MARSGASSPSQTLSYCTTTPNTAHFCDTIAIRTVTSPSGTSIYCHPSNCPVIAFASPYHIRTPVTLDELLGPLLSHSGNSASRRGHDKKDKKNVLSGLFHLVIPLMVSRPALALVPVIGSPFLSVPPAYGGSTCSTPNRPMYWHVCGTLQMGFHALCIHAYIYLFVIPHMTCHH